MALRLSDVLKPMVTAAKDSLLDSWPKVRRYARPEFKRLAQSLIEITGLVAAGKVNKPHARALLEIHKNTTKMVLLTVEGLGLLSVEKAVNAALKAASEVVNTAAGLKLL